jgi:hypothetical protein
MMTTQLGRLTMRGSKILMAAIALGGCNMAEGTSASGESGSGKAGVRNFEVGSFDSVLLGGPHDVVVTIGGPPSVRAEGNAEALERLDIRVEDGHLKIGVKDGWSLGLRRERPRVVIHVTAPSLAAASIGGSGDMRIDRVEGDAFAASVGGSGDMAIASLRTGRADFSIAGSGGIQAAGKVQKVSLSIAGSGDIDAGSLESDMASVSLVGSGDVRARAMKSAEISLLGSGDVSISGTAKCKTSKMGSGDVRCGG